MNWQFSTTYNWNEVRAWSSFLTFLYVHLALKIGYFLLAVEEKEFSREMQEMRSNSARSANS